MGWFFRKSWNIGKLFRVNLSKRGIGYSVGLPGFRIGTGPRGDYVSGGIPGTGIGYRKYFGKRRAKPGGSTTPVPDIEPTAMDTPVITIQVPLNRIRRGDALFWLETVSLGSHECVARVSLSNTSPTRPLLMPPLPGLDPRQGYAIVVDNSGRMYRCLASEGLGGMLPPGVTRTGNLRFEPVDMNDSVYAAVRIGNLHVAPGQADVIDLPFRLPTNR